MNIKIREKGEIKKMIVKTKPRTPKWVQRQLEMSKYVGKRKHSSQMTQQELDSLYSRLRSVEKWELIGHVFDRIEEKGINATYDDISSTVYHCDIIEYKIDYNARINRCEERVVVRSKAVTNGEYNLNVVYNLHSNKVITVWLNHINDFHDTLDWSLYDPNMKVFGVND